MLNRLPSLLRACGRPRRAAVLLALLALGVLGVYRLGWYWRAQTHLGAAQRALARRDFPEARANLMVCLQVWPDRPELHLLAAQAARRAGALDEAADHINSCRALRGEPTAVRLEEALLRAQQGDLAGVERYLLSCIKQGHEQTPLILEALAQGYLRAHRLPNAFHAADCLLQLEPEHLDALLCRARAMEGLAYAHMAVNDYQQVLELDPNHDEARSRLANVLYRLGRFAEAQEQWQRLAQGHPDHPAVLVGLARCLHQAGRLEEARQLLQPLLAAPRKQDPALAEVGKLALLEGGMLALAMKQPAQAEAWLREAVARAPHDYEPNYALAQCLEQIGHREEARHYRTQAEHIQAEQVRLEEVLRRMVQAPGDAALRYQAGVILLRNGLEHDGLRWLQSVLQEDPRHQPSHQVLAEYYERSGKPGLAVRHRQLALQGSGQSPADGAGKTP